MGGIVWKKLLSLLCVPLEWSEKGMDFIMKEQVDNEMKLEFISKASN